MLPIISDNSSHLSTNSVSHPSSQCMDTLNVSRPTLKKDSTKELRRKNLVLGTSIDKLTSEVDNLKKSRVRHANDAATLKLIDRKLEAKLKELSSLQSAEKQIEIEQKNRKDIQKLFSFWSRNDEGRILTQWWERSQWKGWPKCWVGVLSCLKGSLEWSKKGSPTEN